MNLNQVTLPCLHYEDSVRFYQTLGLNLIVSSPPRYARFECLNGATLSLHAQTNAVQTDAVIYFEVQDLDLEVAKLQGKCITFESLPADQTWLWREAHLRDPAGNRLCLFFAGENRRFPPWRVTP